MAERYVSFVYLRILSLYGRLQLISSQIKKLDTYRLQPYDVLLSTKGTIGKVGIIGEIDRPMVASQALQVIRIQDESLRKERAIELYMFFKSELGQAMLKQLVAGVAMPQIATSDIKKLKIPVLNDKEREKVLAGFEKEIQLYRQLEEIEKEIESIHASFLEEE